MGSLRVATAFIALALLAVTSCAATSPPRLVVSFTVPSLEARVGSCLPDTAGIDADSVRVDIAWSGPHSGGLILYRPPGARIDRLDLGIDTAPGDYTVTVRPRIERPGLPALIDSCGAQVVVRVVRLAGRPAPVTDLRSP